MMDLVSELTKQLGVGQDQAEGGAGLLMKLAKDKLQGGDFDTIASALPGVEALIGKAPEANTGGGLGGLASMAGSVLNAVGAEGAGNLANIAQLAGAFKMLNIDMGTAAKFIPIVLSWAQSQGGDGVMALLQKVLK